MFVEDTGWSRTPAQARPHAPLGEDGRLVSTRCREAPASRVADGWMRGDSRQMTAGRRLFGRQDVPLSDPREHPADAVDGLSDYRRDHFRAEDGKQRPESLDVGDRAPPVIQSGPDIPSTLPPPPSRLLSPSHAARWTAVHASGAQAEPTAAVWEWARPAG
jgi:hypothetical protein